MSEEPAPYTARPLRLRYVFEHVTTGERKTVEVDIEEVERPDFWKGMDNYDVVARLLSTGRHDADGREVFEGDVVSAGSHWWTVEMDCRSLTEQGVEVRVVGHAYNRPRGYVVAPGGKDGLDQRVPIW